MRNAKFLDNPQPEDKQISELMYDGDGTPYRIVAGKKVIQSKDKDLNTTANRMRVSGMRPFEYLNKICGY